MRVFVAERRAWIALLTAVAGVGAALQVTQYASDRSVWFDEALLALNFIQRDAASLLKPLDYGQSAPPGFLLAVDGLSLVTGTGESALRAVPLFAGLGAIALFAVVALRALDPPSAVLALTTLAFAEGVVYFASEVKPYSLDVLATTIVLFVGLAAVERRWSARRSLAIGMGTALLPAVSFPSVFMLATVAAVVIAQGYRERDLTRVAALVGPWVITASLGAFIALRGTTAVRTAFDYRADAFLDVSHFTPVLPAEWLDVVLTDTIASLGLPASGPLSHLKLVFVIALVGLVAIAVRSPSTATMIGLPIVFVMAASLLKAYPLSPRTTLFLLPCVALMLGRGMVVPASIRPSVLGYGLSTALVILVVGSPAASAVHSIRVAHKKEELRPVLEVVRRDWRAGDFLVLDYRAQYPFRYYAECKCLPSGVPALSRLFPYVALTSTSTDAPALIPVANWFVLGPREVGRKELRRLLAPRRHGRTWFVFSHADSESQRSLFYSDERLERQLTRDGARVTRIVEHGAGALVIRRADAKDRQR